MTCYQCQISAANSLFRAGVALIISTAAATAHLIGFGIRCGAVERVQYGDLGHAEFGAQLVQRRTTAKTLDSGATGTEL